MADTAFHGELVVGLIYAIGTRTNTTITALTDCLNSAGYQVKVVKISKDVIPRIVAVAPHDETDEYERISVHMDAGNKARKDASESDFGYDGRGVLAHGVAAFINATRERGDDGEGQPNQKAAYIVDSIKHPAELEVLADIYAGGFVGIGLHSSTTRRKSYLTDKQIPPGKADDLISRDKNESMNPEYGQRVENTFYLADFFLNVGNNEDLLRCDVRRMVELWFGSPFHTPTFDEYAMFMAFTAALRSADLSRQVGSVIARDNEIISSGANDCPAYGGGLYWPKRSGDCITDFPGGRDYMRGEDSNTKEQIRIIDDIVKRAVNHGLDEKKVRDSVESSRVTELTEFGRVVHAEMEALLSCSRRGVSTVDAHMYCTTFPCHNCAKHIVAGGITRVVYVEPYEKSKAPEFHNESIDTDSLYYGNNGNAESHDKVIFEPFVGVGPRRFFDVFSMKLGSGYDLKRKNKTGDKREWQIANSKLRLLMSPSHYIDLEDDAASSFDQFASNRG